MPTPTVYMLTFEGLVKLQELDKAELAELYRQRTVMPERESYGDISRMKIRIRQRQAKIDRAIIVLSLIIANQEVEVVGTAPMRLTAHV